MNEPNILTFLMVLAIPMAIAMAHGLIIGLSAPSGRRAVWTAWAAGAFLIVLVGWSLGARYLHVDNHPGDARLLRGLLFAIGVSTAIAAWAVDHVHREQPRISRALLAAIGAGAVIGPLVVISFFAA